MKVGRAWQYLIRQTLYNFGDVDMKLGITKIHVNQSCWQELKVIVLLYGQEGSLANLDLDKNRHLSSDQGSMLAATPYFVTTEHILTFTQIST